MCRKQSADATLHWFVNAIRAAKITIDHIEERLIIAFHGEIVNMQMKHNNQIDIEQYVD